MLFTRRSIKFSNIYCFIVNFYIPRIEEFQKICWQTFLSYSDTEMNDHSINSKFKGAFNAGNYIFWKFFLKIKIIFFLFFLIKRQLNPLCDVRGKDVLNFSSNLAAMGLQPLYNGLDLDEMGDLFPLFYLYFL